MKCFCRILFPILIFLIPLQSCTQNISTKNKKKPMPNNLSEAEWKAKLSSEEYYILREKGTEKPYSGKFLMNKENGNYVCKGCGTVLFNSDSKFDSHCGWPSFDKEIGKGIINYTQDNSHGMQRIEITCANCGGHLGHVFNDGPTETGMRYCVNSVSLDFVPQDKSATLEKALI